MNFAVSLRVALSLAVLFLDPLYLMFKIKSVLHLMVVPLMSVAAIIVQAQFVLLLGIHSMDKARPVLVLRAKKVNVV